MKEGISLGAFNYFFTASLSLHSSCSPNWECPLLMPPVTVPFIFQDLVSLLQHSSVIQNQAFRGQFPTLPLAHYVTQIKLFLFLSLGFLT